jgi:hypothetical protein
MLSKPKLSRRAKTQEKSFAKNAQDFGCGLLLRSRPAGGPPFVSRPEGAPSFRIMCERVGLSFAQVAAEKAL